MMRKDKKERLEKIGWRFRTVEEFLGSSTDATAEVEVRPPLADSLKRRGRRGKPTRRRRAPNKQAK